MPCKSWIGNRGRYFLCGRIISSTRARNFSFDSSKRSSAHRTLRNKSDTTTALSVNSKKNARGSRIRRLAATITIPVDRPTRLPKKNDLAILKSIAGPCVMVMRSENGPQKAPNKVAAIMMPTIGNRRFLVCGESGSEFMKLSVFSCKYSNNISRICGGCHCGLQLRELTLPGSY